MTPHSEKREAPIDMLTLAHLIRGVVLVGVVVATGGCRSYAESTPRRVLAEDGRANYERVFREAVPSGVTVVHSMVVAYESRLGVVTTDDFEFELVVPPSWLTTSASKLRHLQLASESFARQARSRKAEAQAWYAPKPIDRYDLYRDMSSVGYVHMLVDKDREADGRLRVFVSKH